MEKLPSVKLVPGAKKTGDGCHLGYNIREIALRWEWLLAQTVCSVGSYTGIPDQAPVPQELRKDFPADPDKEREPVQALPKPQCWELGLDGITPGAAGTASSAGGCSNIASPTFLGFLFGALVVKNPPANAGDVRAAGSTLVWEEPLEEGMPIHSSILAWRIP